MTMMRESPLVGMDVCKTYKPDAETAVLIQERAFMHILILRAAIKDSSESHDPIEQVMGFSLPQEPNRTRSGASATVLWLSPNEWLVMASEDEHAHRLLHEMRPSKSQHYSMFDVSGGYTIIELQGHYVSEALSALCPLDLSEPAFRPGDCAQSLLGQIPVIMYRPSVDLEGNDELFQVIVRRSFAAFCWDMLFDVSKEFGIKGPKTN